MANSAQYQASLARQASLASVCVAATLIMSKAWAYWMTGSVSLLGSLLDSILDGLTSLMNFVALRFALVPADNEHRFGHGKLEAIAALAQSAFMLGSALMLIMSSLDALLHQRQTENLMWGIGVSLFAIFLTLILVAFQKYVLKRTRSLIVEADSLHYQGDVLMNGAVVLALVMVDFGWFWLDGTLALAIAIFLIVNAIKVGRKALQDLMDRQVEEVENKVQELVANAKDILGCHDVRCRQAGPNLFIQFHLELDENLSLWRAHQLGDQIELQIHQLYPMADVLIHHDPVSVRSS